MCPLNNRWLRSANCSFAYPSNVSRAGEFFLSLLHSLSLSLVLSISGRGKCLARPYLPRMHRFGDINKGWPALTGWREAADPWLVLRCRCCSYLQMQMDVRFFHLFFLFALHNCIASVAVWRWQVGSNRPRSTLHCKMRRVARLPHGNGARCQSGGWLARWY